MIAAWNAENVETRVIREIRFFGRRLLRWKLEKVIPGKIFLDLHANFTGDPGMSGLFGAGRDDQNLRRVYELTAKL